MASLFFWRKKKQTATERAKELMPALIEQLPDFVPAIRQIINPQYRNENDIISPETTRNYITGGYGQEIGKLYDFIMNLDGTNDHNEVVQAWTQPPDGLLPDNNPHKKEDSRIAAKPKDVETELDRVPTPWDVENKTIPVGLFGHHGAM